MIEQIEKLIENAIKANENCCSTYLQAANFIKHLEKKFKKKFSVSEETEPGIRYSVIEWEN